MTFVTKPRVHHPQLKVNDLGLTRRDYEGSVSTLCAGCGHDSISAAIVQACWELDIERRDRAGVRGAVDSAASIRKDFRHRLFVENTHLLPR